MIKLLPNEINQIYNRRTDEAVFHWKYDDLLELNDYYFVLSELFSRYWDEHPKIDCL